MTAGGPSVGPRLVVRERDAFAPSAMAVLVGTLAVLCLASTKVPALAITLTFAPFLAWGLWTTVVASPGEARVEGASLVYALEGKEHRVALAQIRSAWRGALQDPRAAGARAARTFPAVVVELRGGTYLRVSMRDEAEAEDFLRALGMDPTHHRASFHGRRLFHSLIAWLAGIPFAAVATGVTVRLFDDLPWARSPAFALGLFAAMFFALRVLLRPSLDLEVGSNGVLDRTRLRDRFLPWSRVSAVAKHNGWLYFTLRDGSRRAVWCNPDDPAVLPAAFERARDALAAWQRAAAAADPLTALDRNGRTVAQWRADLAGLLASGTGYREQTVDRARLEALAADPAAPLERRVGAALALAHAAPDADARTKVRVAAEANADPDERELLRRVAAGDVDDAALEAALGRRAGA